jgi:5'(3')-deoxyribonucleotidase
MTKPTIAIDVDEVLADYAAEFVIISNKLWGTEFSVEDYHEDWLGLWGVDMDEAVARGRVMLEDRMHERLRHNDEAVDVLNRLAENYNLIVLTARNMAAKDLTLEWLGRHYPMIAPENVNFAGIWDNPKPDAAKQTKGSIAKRLGVQYLIDDQLKHCLAASEHDIKALLFGDYRWNQADSLPGNVTRVSNWAAVEEYFEREARR